MARSQATLVQHITVAEEEARDGLQHGRALLRAAEEL